MPFNIAITRSLPVSALNGGLFIARGRGGRHGERVIDSHELIFVREGVLSLFEEERTFEIASGQTLLLQAGLRHGGAAPYPDDLQFYWAHFRTTAANVGESSNLPQVATLAEPERMTSLFRRFLDDQETQAHLPVVADLTLMQMLFEITRPANRFGAIGAGVLPAQRADEYIRVHAAEPIGAGDVAAAVGYHPDYLGRVYKRLFGEGLTGAIHRRRIHEAKSLLMTSAATIDQIAHRCGYQDVEYFRRVFRKREGISPGAFRRLHARVHVNSE